MQRKILIAVIVGTLVVAGAFAVTASAAGPQDGSGAWQQMWTACRTGDWQGMVDAMRGIQADGGTIPCPRLNDGSCGINGAGGCGGGRITTGAPLN